MGGPRSVVNHTSGTLWRAQTAAERGPTATAAAGGGGAGDARGDERGEEEAGEAKSIYY